MVQNFEFRLDVSNIAALTAVDSQHVVNRYVSQPYIVAYTSLERFEGKADAGYTKWCSSVRIDAQRRGIQLADERYITWSENVLDNRAEDGWRHYGQVFWPVQQQEQSYRRAS